MFCHSDVLQIELRRGVRPFLHHHQVHVDGVGNRAIRVQHVVLGVNDAGQVTRPRVVVELTDLLLANRRVAATENPVGRATQFHQLPRCC